MPCNTQPFISADMQHIVLIVGCVRGYELLGVTWPGDDIVGIAINVHAMARDYKPITRERLDEVTTKLAALGHLRRQECSNPTSGHSYHLGSTEQGLRDVRDVKHGIDADFNTFTLIDVLISSMLVGGAHA